MDKLHNYVERIYFLNNGCYKNGKKDTISVIAGRLQRGLNTSSKASILYIRTTTDKL